MIKYLFFKEIQIALLNKRLMFSCLAIILLMVVGGWVCEQQYISKQVEYELFTQSNKQNIMENTSSRRENMEGYFQWMKQKGHNVSQEEMDESFKLQLSDLLSIKQNLCKSPSKLSFIATNDSHMPNGLEMNYFEIGLPKSFNIANNYFRAFTTLNWTFIIIYLLSFVCLCFAYDAFSGEKQNGTLKLCLAGAIPRWKILIGKLFALWCVLITPIIIGVIIFLIIIQLSSNIMLVQDDYFKILIFLLFVFIITGINILLFFGISILTSRPSISSIVCLLVWFIFVFILPSTSWLIASKLSPIPAIDEQNRKEELLLKDVKNETWSDRWIGNPTQEVYTWINMCNRKSSIHNEIWDQYRNLLFQQTEKSISFSKISPFSVFRWLSDRISDNDYYGYMNFQSQASLYQETYCNFIKDKDASDPKSFHLIWNCPYNKSEFFMSHNVIDPNEVPVFGYQSPRVNTIIYESVRDFLILLMWLIVLFVGVTYAFIKYDIR